MLERDLKEPPWVLALISIDYFLSFKVLSLIPIRCLPESLPRAVYDIMVESLIKGWLVGDLFSWSIFLRIILAPILGKSKPNNSYEISFSSMNF